MANRLEECALYLISPCQNGFMKGQSVFGNLHNLKYVVVMIDFQKCFDWIEFKSIRGAFQYFGFGEKFIEMLFLLYNNLQLCTSNNGYFSDFMVKGRGTNQGCPGSPLVYNFVGGNGTFDIE